MKNKYIRRLIRTGGSFSLLPLRLAMGAVFIAHGAQKLFGWFEGNGLQATAAFFGESLGFTPGILWASLAGGGEFFGGILILLGLLTRVGAALTGAVMTVAIIAVHWGIFFLPNGMEYALTLFAGSLTLLIAGAGNLSVDRALTEK